MQATLQQTFDAITSGWAFRPEEQPPNHYRLLGVGLFESQPAVIASAADRQMGHLRTFQSGRHSVLSQQLLNEVAAAKVCLLNPAKKAAYDARLRQQQAVAAEDAAQAPANSSQWADITDELSSAARTRRITRKRRTNVGPTIAVWATCVSLLVGLLAWNTTQQVDSPVDRTAAAKVGKRQTSEQPTRRESHTQPKARVSATRRTIQTVCSRGDKPGVPNAPVLPGEAPVYEALSAAKTQSPAQLATPFEEANASQVAGVPSFDASGDKPAEGSATPEDRPLASKKRLPVPDNAIQQRTAERLGGLYAISRVKPAERIALATRTPSSRWNVEEPQRAVCAVAQCREPRLPKRRYRPSEPSR